MNKDLPILDTLGFYVLPYLHDEIRILRDIIISNAHVVVNAIKMKPLAFIITHPAITNKLPNWSDYYSIHPNDEREVELFGNQECSLEWPERAYHPITFGKMPLSQL